MKIILNRIEEKTLETMNNLDSKIAIAEYKVYNFNIIYDKNFTSAAAAATELQATFKIRLSHKHTIYLSGVT